MSPLFDLVAGILAAFYSAIPNYAVAIILLTALVMAITTPLTLKSTRSMMMMQQLQPEMKRIQARFKDDRQKANEEMLKFYKENNINPLGGCIPLLVQMPVFFFLYAVLRGLTRRVSDVGFSVGYVGGQTATGVGLNNPPVELLPFDPAYLDHSSAMYQSLSHTTTMSAPPLNIDLSESMVQAFGRGALAAAPYILLIAVVGFTSFYQQRQIQGRNPNQQVNPQTQTMMKIMPIILPVISLNLPAGLVLYFAVSNLWRVGLQGFISRSIYGIKRGQAASEKGSGAKALAGKNGDAGGSSSGSTSSLPAMPWSKRSKGAAIDVEEVEEVDVATSNRNGRNRNGRNGNGAKPSTKQPAKQPTRQPTSKSTGKGATGKAPSDGSSTNGNGKTATSGNGKATNGRSSPKSQPAKSQPAKSQPASKQSAKSQQARSQPASKQPAKNDVGTQKARSGSDDSSSPTLQPRARRPKKR